MKNKNILPVFSYIFHPIFISIYGALFYFWVAKGFYTEVQLYVMLLQILILTFFLPLSLYFLYRSMGIVQSFTEASIKERRMPIATQLVLLLILIKFSITKETSSVLFHFFLGGLFSSGIALTLLFLKIKASLHLIGISALTSFVFCLQLYFGFATPIFLIVGVVLMGLVASSRLYMKAHTPIELVIGTAVGIGPQLLLLGHW